jgi:hypothetical protein
MTAGRTGDRPKLVLAVGAPDGMTFKEATQRFNSTSKGLHGNSGIATTLLPWLQEHGHPYAVTMFGSEGHMGPEAAQRVFERSGGRVLVNLICEPHLQRALRQVARFELETQLPLVNPSWAVASTTRPLIARRLAHQPGVRAPHCTFYPGGAVTLAEHIEAHGHRYPVLLRPPGKHGSVGLVRVDDADAIAGHPTMARACTVTDFVDFRSADGLWRKYRLVYAGDRLFRRHVLTDREWNLTRAARPFMNDRPELVAQEQEWIGRPVTLQADSIEARIMHQFRALQLDFGVIDFALPPDGDLVVFEINACLQLTNPTDAEAATDARYFEANNDEILATLAAAISVRAAQPAQLRGPHAG